MAAVEGEALDEREPCEELSMVVSWCIVRLTGLVEPRPDLEATRCVSVYGIIVRPCDKDWS